MESLERAEHLKSICLRLLARREHSALQLKLKLKKRGYDGIEVDRVIEQLSTQGLQCNKRFAEDYCRYRVARGYGPLRIHQELRERGVSESVIGQCLSELNDSWHEVIAVEFRKKQKKNFLQSDDSLLKTIRFLARRGFTSEQIRKVLDGYSASSVIDRV